MSDIARDIGGLEARMDEHDRRFDRIEEIVTTGFRETKAAIDDLRGHESRRKGALAVVKILLGGGVAASAWELIKGYLHR